MVYIFYLRYPLNLRIYPSHKLIDDGEELPILERCGESVGTDRSLLRIIKPCHLF